MLSILLSYLKNVEYQQWLSLVHCQLLYEAILVEWDGSQSRESSAAVCTTTPVTARLPRSFYISLLYWELPWCWCWWFSVLNSRGWSACLGCGCLSSSPFSDTSFWSFSWACWQPAVEGVSNRVIGKQQHWDQSELGECPQFCGQSGRRLVVTRGQKREGAFREIVQGALCCLYLFYSCMYLLRHCGLSRWKYFISWHKLTRKTWYQATFLLFANTKHFTAILTF